MQVYRTRDLQAIEDNLKKIVDRAKRETNRLVEPTLDECSAVQQILFEYARRRRRPLYGGWAYHKLLERKGQAGVYPMPLEDCKDVEFYSPTPIEDMVELCNTLEKKLPGRFTKGDKAQHEGTITIFVNLQPVCDITFLPNNLLRAVPWVEHDGFRVPPPSWILVDILRQFTDPLLSYWRLPEKTFHRARRLMETYPLEVARGVPRMDDRVPKEAVPIVRYLAALLAADKDRYLFLGEIARTYFADPSTKVLPDNRALEVVTDSLGPSAKQIVQWLQALPGVTGELTIEEFHPFFQFWDQRVVFRWKGTPVLTLYGSYLRCTPYRDAELNGTTFRIGTFPVVVNHELIRSFERLAKGDAAGRENALRRLRVLLEARDKALADQDVLAASPYEEFTVECVGKTVHPRRIHFLQILRQKHRPFQYVPSRSSEKEFQMPEYPFDNISGNPISGRLNRVLRRDSVTLGKSLPEEESE